MKIRCPDCETIYNVPDEKLSDKDITATCKKCGANILIQRELEQVSASDDSPQQANGKRQTPEPPSESLPRSPDQSEQSGFSVASMSPEYPRRRDALIFIVAAAVMIIIFAGGYFALKGTVTPSLKTGWNPMASLLQLLKGGEVYETCESFVLQNEKLFRPLGGNLQLSLVRQNVKSVNGRKTARVMIKVQGKRAAGQLYFQLRKDGDKWRVITAGMTIGKGKYKTVYPSKTSDTTGKI